MDKKYFKNHCAIPFPFLLFISAIFCVVHNCHAESTLAKNDAFPPFTTLDPHTFLHQHEKLRLKAPYFYLDKDNSVSLSVAAFGQHADSGRNANGDKFFPGPLQKEVSIGDPDNSTSTTVAECTTTLTCTTERQGFRVELGDIAGRANMIALMLGDVPEGATIPPALQNAIDIIAPDASMLDPKQLLGNFSIPLKYRKRGIRFEMLINLLGGFGFGLRTGVASISQTVGGFHDLTCHATNTCPVLVPDDSNGTKFKELQSKIETYLMVPMPTIVRELGLDIGNFTENSIEEIRLSVFWRHAFEVNSERPEWPYILLTPFFQLTGSISPVKMQNTNKVFSLPFGNNRHNAIEFSAGLNFDFVETIEVGAEVGITHFMEKTFCDYRVPTHPDQRVFYPFTANVDIRPGRNWYFAAKIAAFHFLERLSCYFQFVMIEHKEDRITLANKAACTPFSCDSPFKLKTLENISVWKSKVANVGFNYDLSPNIGVGFLWQAPLSQRNSYRSSTLMLSLYATF